MRCQTCLRVFPANCRLDCRLGWVSGDKSHWHAHPQRFARCGRSLTNWHADYRFPWLPRPGRLNVLSNGHQHSQPQLPDRPDPKHRFRLPGPWPASRFLAGPGPRRSLRRTVRRVTVRLLPLRPDHYFDYSHKPLASPQGPLQGEEVVASAVEVRDRLGRSADLERLLRHLVVHNGVRCPIRARCKLSRVMLLIHWEQDRYRRHWPFEGSHQPCTAGHLSYPDTSIYVLDAPPGPDRQTCSDT